MSKGVRKTIEEVRLSFEREGYTLLSKEYINCKTKLEYECPKGHRHLITWTSWQQGKRCPSCSINARLDIDFLRRAFESEGYKLLSRTYKNNKQLLEYKCPNGHIHKIKWNDWVDGHRCYFCLGNVKPEFEVVKTAFESEGYTLVSTNYINAITKLKYVCNNGHTGSITWCGWRRGRRCAECAHINKFGAGNPAWKGGISFEPYCPIWKDKDYKESIKRRDDYKCLNPSCDSKNPNDLTIHHIDYNKKNCSPHNLITVCRSCNIKANKDRSWHTAWYRTILKNRYQC